MPDGPLEIVITLKKEHEQCNELEISSTSVQVCALQPLGEKTQSPVTWNPSRINSERRQEQLADPSLAKVINWKETSSTPPPLPPQWSQQSTSLRANPNMLRNSGIGFSGSMHLLERTCCWRALTKNGVMTAGHERGFIWDIGLREYNSTHVDKGLDFLNFS